MERAVEVVIRRQKLQLNYFIGLNQNTMQKLLADWNVNDLTRSDSGIPDEDAVVATFEKSLPTQLIESICLKVNDSNHKLVNVAMETCPKHHFDFVIKFEFELPTDQTVEIELSDQNLKQWKSAARYSLKGVGGTIVANSNVAPIIIRSKRIDFQKLGEDERAAKCKIIATVITPPSDSKNESAIQ